jgi:hypothetical protein
MKIDLLHIAALTLPLLFRSAIHHVYHRVCHSLIHHTGHKIHFVGRILAKFKWLMDAILIACLAAFGAATEHEPEQHNEIEKTGE